MSEEDKALIQVLNYNIDGELIYGMLEAIEQSKGVEFILKEYTGHGRSQLHLYYMYLVMRFGNYGTSPRYGWIQLTPEFNNYAKEVKGELMI